MLARDENPTQRGISTPFPKSGRLSDHHRLSPKSWQSSNPDHRFHPIGSQQVQPIGAHSIPRWLGDIVLTAARELLRKAKGLSQVISNTYYVWGPRGNGPICQLEHVHISSNRTQSRKKVLIRVKIGDLLLCCFRSKETRHVCMIFIEVTLLILWWINFTWS